MIRLLLIALLVSANAFAGFDTPTITHAKVWPFQLYPLGAAGTMEIVGNFDTDTTVAEFQYRVGDGSWVDITTDRTRLVFKLTRSRNFRGWGFGFLTNTSLEIRTCSANAFCSVPFLVNLLPEFTKIILPKTGVVTATNRNLRFGIIRHVAGMKFHIGKLNPFPTYTAIQYDPMEEVLPVGNCPGLPGSDPFACEIVVPESIIKNPGVYYLTGTSPIGSSVNVLRFEVQSIWKIVSIIPEKIRFHVQDVLTFNFAGGMFRPGDIDITMLSCNRKLAVTPGKEVALARIPPQCMPTSGAGNLHFEIKTQGGSERLEVPYEL